MLIADGGGYGGTNWMAKDVIQIWQAIENQDTTAHYQLLAGWRRSYELTLEHLSHVQSYRQNLAEAWPPEKSPASAAYLQRLDDLIANLQSTYDAAVANHDAFASATLAISLSRNDVEKIYNEYTSNQAKLEEFKHRPYVAAGKSAVPPQKPPVPDGRQEQLNNQARSIMYGLSSEIIQARTQITTPPKYDPTRKRGMDGDQDDGTNYVPPPIPPVTPFDPDTKPHTTSSSGASQPWATHTTNPGTEPLTPGPNVGRQPGLILGGIQPTPIVPPPSTTTIGSPPLGGPLPNVISPPPIPPTPLLGSPPIGPPPAAGFNKEFVGERLLRPATGGMRAMPPGGVIGGPPGGGLGQPGGGGRAASRINPVGGVINPSSSEGRQGGTGRGVPSAQSATNLSGRNSGRREESGNTSHWDPENPWETSEGVSPVVLPATEQRVDPGPAIGLR